MDIVTVSSKYQVVIPRSIRRRLHIQPGEQLQVINLDDRIEMIPIRPMPEMKGFLKGFNTTFDRDEDDRV